MKKLLMIAVATTAILPMAAQADETANSTINLSATAPKTCQVRGIFDSSNKNVQDGTVTFADAVDKDNATVNNTTYANLKLDAFCNYAGHAVSLESKHGGLTNKANTATEGNFLKRIGYRVLISNWDPAITFQEFEAIGTSNTNADEPRKSVETKIDKPVNKTEAKIQIATMISTGSGDKTPLLAGDYTDVLTIKLGATL